MELLTSFSGENMCHLSGAQEGFRPVVSNPGSGRVNPLPMDGYVDSAGGVGALGVGGGSKRNRLTGATPRPESGHLDRPKFQSPTRALTRRISVWARRPSTPNSSKSRTLLKEAM